MQQLAEWVKFEFEEAYPVDKLSAYHRLYSNSKLFKNYGTEERTVVDPRGYQEVLSPLTDSIRSFNFTEFHLSKRVLSVDYSQNCASVETYDVQSMERVLFHGDVIVSTVSIGVLQNDRIAFNPVLPPWKRKVLHKAAEMVNYLKIYMTFTEAFWPADREVFYLAGSEKKGRWARWRIWKSKDTLRANSTNNMN